MRRARAGGASARASSRRSRLLRGRRSAPSAWYPPCRRSLPCLRLRCRPRRGCGELPGESVSLSSSLVSIIIVALWRHRLRDGLPPMSLVSSNTPTNAHCRTRIMTTWFPAALERSLLSSSALAVYPGLEGEAPCCRRRLGQCPAPCGNPPSLGHLSEGAELVQESPAGPIAAPDAECWSLQSPPPARRAARSELVVVIPLSSHVFSHSFPLFTPATCSGGSPPPPRCAYAHASSTTRTPEGSRGSTGGRCPSRRACPTRTCGARRPPPAS